MNKKSLYSALLASAVIAGVYATPASANIDLSNWQVSLPGFVDTHINQLNFNGESYVTNTATSTPGIYTSTDNVVFNFLSYNNGNVLNLNGGQMTGVFNAHDITNLTGSTPNYVFTGGSFTLYYNPKAVYGTTAANMYGAQTGTAFATFNIQATGNPNTGGGFLNVNGTPLSNGTVTLSTTPPATLTNSPFLDSTGAPLSQNILLGFITTNAAEDPSANPGSYTIDPNLVQALSGTPGTTNNAPTQIFISNGGQLKLQDIPEPATLALMGIGLLGIALSVRRNQRN